MRPLYALVPTLLLVACKDDDKPRITQTTSETYSQVPATSADILWVVDNSISMQQEQFKVMDGAQNFVDTFERVGVDFHLGVITTDVTDEHGEAGVLQGSPAYLTGDDPDYVESFKDRVDVGIAGDDQESGLEASVLALTEPNVSTVNAGFLRDDARLSIIVLSDEDDCSDFDAGLIAEGNDGGIECYSHQEYLTPVADIVDMLTALKPDSAKIQVSAIIGYEGGFCESANAGTRYQDTSDAIGGFIGNICSANYQAIMRDLGLVAAGMQVEYQLAYEPYGNSLEAWIHTEEGSDYEVLEDEENGWTYWNDPPTVTFHGDGIPPRGSTLTLTYEY